MRLSDETYQRTSKQPCVVPCSALFLLTAAGTSILNLPLTFDERRCLEGALAEAHRAMNRSMGTAPVALPTDWVQQEALHD